jgi:hypothetical protein
MKEKADIEVKHFFAIKPNFEDSNGEDFYLEMMNTFDNLLELA